MLLEHTVVSVVLITLRLRTRDSATWLVGRDADALGARQHFGGTGEGRSQAHIVGGHIDLWHGLILAVRELQNNGKGWELFNWYVWPGHEHQDRVVLLAQRQQQLAWPRSFV